LIVVLPAAMATKPWIVGVIYIANVSHINKLNAGNVSNDTAYLLSCCCTLLTTSSKVGDTQQTSLETS